MSIQIVGPVSKRAGFFFASWKYSRAALSVGMCVRDMCERVTKWRYAKTITTNSPFRMYSSTRRWSYIFISSRHCRTLYTLATDNESENDFEWRWHHLIYACDRNEFYEKWRQLVDALRILISNRKYISMSRQHLNVSLSPESVDDDHGIVQCTRS